MTMGEEQNKPVDGQIVDPAETKAIAPVAKTQTALLPDARNLWMLAQGFFNSGLFPNTKNAYGAMAIIELGREIGVPPMIALNTINIIEGKPAMAGQLMLALIERHGIKVEIVQKDKKACRLTLTHQGKAPFTETVTIEDAAQIKDKSGKALTDKINWLNYPEEMLFWRCLAKGARAYCPDVILGLYGQEELDGAASGPTAEPKPAVKPKPQPKPKAQAPEDRKVAPPPVMNTTPKPEARSDLDGRTVDEVRNILSSEITCAVAEAGLIVDDFLGWLFLLQDPKKRKWVTKGPLGFTLEGGKLEDIAFLAQSAVIKAAIAVFKEGMVKTEEKKV
jgi:hypothetical protein